jgi:hypothetical protein
MNINDSKMNCVPQGNLMLKVQGVMIFSDRSRAFAASWCASVDVSSSHIYDEDRDKRDDTKSISRMNMTDLY